MHLITFNRVCLKNSEFDNYYLRCSCRQASNFETPAAHGLKEFTQTESELVSCSICAYFPALFLCFIDFTFT